MNKLTILVGENISNLHFQNGGSMQEGLVVSPDAVKWVHFTESTSRSCPEDKKHPKVYQSWLKQEIEYVLSSWNLIVSTNSMHTINIVAGMVRDGDIPNSAVEIICLSDDNRKVLWTCGIDSEGYLDENWVVGFLSLN